MTWLYRSLIEAATEYLDEPAIDSVQSGQVSYKSLFSNALSLNDQLGSAKKIGILCTRSAEAYLGVLACYLNGRVFVPLNPAYPTERLRSIVSAADVDLVLHQNANESTLSALGVPDQPITFMPPSEADCQWNSSMLKSPAPTATAYQMFTSGSTGAPKGVPITHHSLSHYIEEVTNHIDFPTGARYSQLFDLSFDLSIHDIFVTLSRGGTIVPASDTQLLIPGSYINKQRIDVWFSVPTLSVAAAKPASGKPIKHKLQLALFCGEALPMDYVQNFRSLMDKDAPIYNLYGPTEATIAFTSHKLSSSDNRFSTAPIGSSFGENTLGLLTEHGPTTAPAEGDEGELLLSGPQIFHGYEPHRDTDCFIYHESLRFYRSGDTVRVNDDVFHFIGRIGSQVKIRGYRIELGEIEAVFRKTYKLQNVAAVVVGLGNQSRICLAYEGDVEITDTHDASNILPKHMMPQSLVKLTALPQNNNGKIDRKALGAITWPDQP